jgi:hypothetical protein
MSPSRITTIRSDGECLLEIVGHVHRGDAEATLELLQLHPHLGAQLGVEVRQGLVEEEHGGREHECPGQRDALLLASGEPGRAARVELAELHQVERLAHTGRHLRLGPSPHPKSIGDVVEHRHVGPDRVGLEDHREPAALGGDVHAGRAREHRASADPDLAGRGPLQPGDRAERGRLAAAGGAEQRDVLAGAHRKRYAPDRLDPAVANDQVAHLDRGLAHLTRLRPGRHGGPPRT